MFLNFFSVYYAYLAGLRMKKQDGDFFGHLQPQKNDKL